jgi:DNA-binding CsgD family transcriptional regulator
VNLSPESRPRWVGVYAEQLIQARGSEEQLKRVFERSLVPMVMLDEDRRYVDANAAACSALSMSVVELRRVRLDDLTPSVYHPTLETNWTRLIETGVLAWPVRDVDPNYLGFTTYALANALPGKHVLAFAPAGFPREGSLREVDGERSQPSSPLTPRELQVLALASEGHSAAMIARELMLSPATVRTHFENIYAKLDVRDRAAAVALAMRMGLID